MRKDHGRSVSFTNPEKIKKGFSVSFAFAVRKDHG